MLGTIIGDLAGSVYGYNEFKSKDININRRMEILSFSKFFDKIRLTNKFDSSCLVFDNCLTAFFESDSFEDAIRKAVSLGGDTDTVGAITVK